MMVLRPSPNKTSNDKLINLDKFLINNLCWECGDKGPNFYTYKVDIDNHNMSFFKGGSRT